MDLIHFIHVCQGFDKETYFGTTGVCQRIKNNLWQLQNFPENSFYQDCSLLRSRHAYLFCGSCEIFWNEHDVFRFHPHIPKFCDTSICHNLHCLESTQSLCLPSSPLLYSQQCMYCMYECTVYLRTCQVCIKASSIQLMMEKEVPSSCPTDVGLLLCTVVNKFFFSVKMCINAFTGTERSLGLFLWRTVLFPRHIWVSVSLVLVMSTLNHMKPFTARRENREK